MPSKKLTFSGYSGESLAARFDTPQSAIRAVALFAHCFSCSKDILAARRIAQRLNSEGIAVLRFDFTGLGHSQGEFSNTNFTSNVGDLIAAANHLANMNLGPDILIGHSLGGAAVVTAASRIDGVKAAATIGAPSDAEHVISVFSEDLERIEETGQAEVLLAGRPFKITKQFVDDVRGSNVRDAAAALNLPLLVMHSPLDQTVGIDNATNLFVAAKHPKSFVSLDTADHLLTRREDAEFAADMIAAWANRYLPVHSAAEPADGRSAVIVEETGNGAYENAVTIGAHHFIADEPVSVGGGGRGPDPYEWVSAGLGACTSMTLRMYANRKQWPLDRVKVTTRHSKDHADDCDHCEDGRKVDIFDREIEIEGDLDEAQRARLLEIADRCPVHRTLHETVLVRTRAV